MSLWLVIHLLAVWPDLGSIGEWQPPSYPPAGAALTTGEQKLSVPVATAPAAAKFRGGGRRVAESPPPPLPPARPRPWGPPLVPVCSASLSLGVCGWPPERPSLPSVWDWPHPGSLLLRSRPPSSRGWMEGERLPGCQRRGVPEHPAPSWEHGRKTRRPRGRRR